MPERTGTLTLTTLVGPAWYPIALVLTTMPCAWLGGALHRVGPTSGRT
jgi:hypothetical protein